MKTRKYLGLILVAVLIAAFCRMAWAMTVEQDVTAAYVREHAKEFSIKVERGKSGLLNFTVTRTLKEPKYFVAEFTLRHGGRVLAESYSPSYGKKSDNKFYFSLSAEDIAESGFVLGESSYGKTDDGELVPVPGTINYVIHLTDFVPKDLLDNTTAK